MGDTVKRCMQRLNAKKTLKILTAIVLTPIVVFIVLTVLLYIPPVQNWVAHGVASYASEKTGDSITVGRVSLSYPQIGRASCRERV